jgi:pyruvate formate lyase activating enzyme
MKFTRRSFIKGAIGLGLGALGAGTIWSNLGRQPQDAPLPDLPSYARPARFYLPMAEASHCSDCHSGTQPSVSTFCHVKHSGTYVKCQLCPKGCLISEGHRGDCGVRENRGGVLYTMTYGNPCAVHVDPIEKKPFFHFLPASLAFSLATAGCNLHCLYCQNWEFSQRRPEEVESIDLPPDQVVAQALRSGSTAIAFTYSEPTVFYEYMFDTAQIARAQGMRSVVISAGYIEQEPLQQLCAVVDAIKIDLKGINEQFYRDVCAATLAPVLETIRTIARSGVHLEVVNLVVPTLNDDLEDMRTLARWLHEEAGPNVPLHFSRFFAQYRLPDLPPTPVERLRQAREIALAEGLHYVYIGNVPGDEGSNTYCPQCGEAVIVRSGYSVVEMHMHGGQCDYCGFEIAGVWE